MIDVENLTKLYRSQQKQPGMFAAIKSLFNNNMSYRIALNNISFHINEGEVVGVLGPNGAGKTTILKILSGVLFPTQGRVMVGGHVPWNREYDFKKKISMVTGQKNQLLWDISPMDSFLWLKEIYNVPNELFKRIIKELAVLLDVEREMNIQLRRLSFGQRMKMELIASLIHCPQIIFLDEPTIGLDIVTQNNIHSFISEHNKSNGTTIILTSHNMFDIEKLCRHVLIVTNGEIYYDGNIMNLSRMYSDHKIISVKLESGQLDLSHFGDMIGQIEYKEQSYRIQTPQKCFHDVASILWGKYDISDFNVQEPSISEIVEKLFIESKEKHEASISNCEE